MKAAHKLEKRVAALEERENPTIATLADFVLWRAKGGGGNPRIDPNLKAVLDGFVRKSRSRCQQYHKKRGA